MSTRDLVTILASLLALVCCAPSASAQQVVPAGAGSYYNGIPAGRERPVDNNGAPVTPKVSTSFVGTPPTNEY